MKYKLLENDTKSIEGSILYRIQATSTFSDVKEGDIGGWVESPYNLSRYGDCWIYDDAIVREKAIISDNAKIKDQAMIFGLAEISGDAIICDTVQVKDRSKVFDKAQMYGSSRCYNKAEIFGNAKINDQARVFKEAWVYDDAEVNGQAYVSGKCTKTPIVLMGLPYTVTIMDEEISFDCEIRTHQQWLDISTEELFIIDKIKAVRFYRKYSEMISGISEIHQKNNFGKNNKNNIQGVDSLLFLLYGDSVIRKKGLEMLGYFIANYTSCGLNKDSQKFFCKRDAEKFLKKIKKMKCVSFAVLKEL